MADRSHIHSGCVQATRQPDQDRQLHMMTRGGKTIVDPCQTCLPPRNNHEAKDCFEHPRNTHRRPSGWVSARGRKPKTTKPPRRKGKRPFDVSGLNASEVSAALATAKDAKQAALKKSKGEG